MKSVIFDFVTGAAIIMGLVIVTRVMKANQFFIESSAQSETEIEQLYVGTYDDEGVELKENTYTVADVYGTLTSYTKSDGTLMDKYEIIVRTSTNSVRANGDVGTLQERQTGVNSVRTFLETMLNNPNGNKFKRTKTQKVNPWNCSCGKTNIGGNVWKCPQCGTNKQVDSTVIIYEFVKQ